MRANAKSRMTEKAGISMGVSLRLRVLLGLIACSAVQCASIASDHVYRYQVESDPQGASVTVYADGVAGPVLTTPGEVMLDLADDITLKFELPGYNTHLMVLQKDIDMWAIGNVVCGGVIGIAIDFATGALWKPVNPVILWRFQKTESSGADQATGAYTVSLRVRASDGREYAGEFVMSPGAETRTEFLRNVVRP